jgi:hypothetical protein
MHQNMTPCTLMILAKLDLSFVNGDKVTLEIRIEKKILVGFM